jgi:glucosyl-3-phosphoglycerate synthase
MIQSVKDRSFRPYELNFNVMADFHINKVPTFSLLQHESCAGMEAKVLQASAKIPVGVLIPALFRDLSGEAMRHIIQVLSEIHYIRKVYISLDQADREEFDMAQRIVAPLEDKAVLVWNDKPEVLALLKRIENQLPLGLRGKGRAVWTCLGYVIGKAEVSAIAFHDADVITYDRDFLTRLLFPLMYLRFQYVKGYYIRYDKKLYGRATRLFYFPLVRTLKDMFGSTDFLDYMGDFRYPLSGEFATYTSQARMMQFPSDWGIEVGLLGEIYRLVRESRICQIELTNRYDHKHQQVGSDKEKGLFKMASDIARTFFTHLASNGVPLNNELFRTIRLTYLKHAREMVGIYESLAEMHEERISFDFHEELKTVEIFAKAIDAGVVDFNDQHFGSPLIPDWKRVESAIDGILPELVEAVENGY